MDDVRLLVSESTTNALLHGTDEIGVKLMYTDEQIGVVVIGSRTRLCRPLRRNASPRADAAWGSWWT
ncbi:hypothetical protein [Streptomyces sp. TE33382]